jgi:hypothetical protein
MATAQPLVSADDPKMVSLLQMMQEDPEYAALQQKRAVAQALAQGTMGAQGGTFRKNPLTVALDFMNLRNAKSQNETAQQAQVALLRQNQQGQQSGQDELLQGLQSQDPRAAILKAMTSRYPGLSKMGGDLYKSNGDTFTKLIDSLKDQIDPQSALQAAPSQNIGMVRPAPPLGAPQLASGTDPSGKQVSWINQFDRGGRVIPHTLPQGSSATINMEGKPATETEEQMGKFYAAGGKGFEQGQALQQRLQGTQDVLRSMDEQPAMGAGANAFQTMRKWAESLHPGISEGLASNTELAKMQLGERVIKELGGLGNQVSNADVEFMNNAMGSLDSDPTALRRMMLIAMKYQMRGLATLQTNAKQVESMKSFSDRGITFPGYSFNVTQPGLDDAMQGTLGNVTQPRTLPRLGGQSRIAPR